MIALVRMRLAGFVRTGRVLPSLLATLVLLGIMYGGGKAQAAEAYGFSALALFPIMAWQAKLVLDTEPDVQRRLALVAVGYRRELIAGLVAAFAVTAATVAFALVAPWLIGAVTSGGIQGPRVATDLPLAQGIAIGAWAHVVALVPAVALGALASRSVTGSTRYGVSVLVLGSLLAVVLGYWGSLGPWLAPPLMAAARMLAHSSVDGVDVLAISLRALVWSAAVIGGYARLRLTRS